MGQNNNSDSNARSKKQIRKEEKRRLQDSKRLEHDAFAKELALRRRRSSSLAAKTETPEMRERYGLLSRNIHTQSHRNNWRKLSKLLALNNS